MSHSAGNAKRILPIIPRLVFVGVAVLAGLLMNNGDGDSRKETPVVPEKYNSSYVVPKKVGTEVITVYPGKWTERIDIPPGHWWKFEGDGKGPLIMRRWDGKVVTISKDEMKWFGDNIPASSFWLKGGASVPQKVTLTFEKK